MSLEICIHVIIFPAMIAKIKANSSFQLSMAQIFKFRPIKILRKFITGIKHLNMEEIILIKVKWKCSKIIYPKHWDT